MLFHNIDNDVLRVIQCSIDAKKYDFNQTETDFEKVIKTKDNTKIAKFLKNSTVITLTFIKAVLSEVVVNQISTNFFNT